jgi:glutaredoxin
LKPIDVTITVNSKTACPFCDDAKAFLSDLGIPFTEAKYVDDAARNDLYDKLGLVGDQRRVPQVMLTYAGENLRIGGARELRMSGVASLFGLAAATAKPTSHSPASIEAPGMVIVEDGSTCCE